MLNTRDSWTSCCAFVAPSFPIPGRANFLSYRPSVEVGCPIKCLSVKAPRAVIHTPHNDDFSYSVCPLSLDSNSFTIQPKKDNDRDESAQFESSVPPPSGGSYGSSGGRDRNEGDGSDNPGRDDILKTFGKTDADISADLRTLSPTQLASYLQATKSGIGAWLARSWPGWRRRVAADPEFPFKVLMEETMGLGLAASGMIAARGKKILSEIDLAFCDIAVGGTLNFILVYLLAPAIGARASTLSNLPSNLFVKGNYPLYSRVIGFLYKGILFSVCGFAGSVVGSTLSQSLIATRRAVASIRNPDQQLPEKALPNIFINSAAWAGFMFISSNPRYQTVAGVERLLFGVAPDSVAKVSCGLLRTANNVLGGAHWVWWAKAIGLQKSNEPLVE